MNNQLGSLPLSLHAVLVRGLKSCAAFKPPHNSGRGGKLTGQSHRDVDTNVDAHTELYTLTHTCFRPLANKNTTERERKGQREASDLHTLFSVLLAAAYANYYTTTPEPCSLQPWSVYLNVMSDPRTSSPALTPEPPQNSQKKGKWTSKVLKKHKLESSLCKCVLILCFEALN